MKANELKLGNYVKTDNGTIGKIVSIQTPNSVRIEILNTIEVISLNINEIHPIKLDNEWLLKFGFSNSEYKKGYTGIDVKSDTGMTTDFVITIPKFMGEWQNFYSLELPSHRFVTIEYVHELQIIFFAFTGKEFELKNKN